MPPIFVFDVNETLLDLSAFDPAFQENFGSASIRTEWFKEVLQLAFVTTITSAYSDFGVIGKAALEIVEKRHHKPLAEERRSQILETIRKLPPHPDVQEGLGRLSNAGIPAAVRTAR